MDWLLSTCPLRQKKNNSYPQREKKKERRELQSHWRDYFRNNSHTERRVIRSRAHNIHRHTFIDAVNSAPSSTAFSERPLPLPRQSLETSWMHVHLVDRPSHYKYLQCRCYIFTEDSSDHISAPEFAPLMLDGC